MQPKYDHFLSDKAEVVEYGFYGRAGTECSVAIINQVHGVECHYVGDDFDTSVNGDALITDVKGIMVAVRTADCAPVLFYGERDNGSIIVAAAHAGWRGALAGVLGSVVDRYLDMGGDISKLKAAVGPCIGQSSYEVDSGFYRSFCEKDDSYERFFKDGVNGGKYQFDLSGFCVADLARLGVTRVFDCGVDTYKSEADFFSYRRSSQRGEVEKGRQISAIGIV